MSVNKVPEEKRDFYYYLCENVSIAAANYWLEDDFGKLIREIASECELA